MGRKANSATEAIEFQKRMITDFAKLEAKICEKSLGDYLRAAWPLLEPTTPLIDNWHIDCISEHLEACTTGQIKRLVVNIPPKSLKSTITSVMWPTWVWGPRHQPGTRWLFASYSDAVAVRDSLNRRNLIGTPWYQRKWGGHVVMQSAMRLKDTDHVFENASRGRMQASTMAGEGTGLGGKFLVIDDPHNPTEILSNVERERTLYNFDQKFFNRLDNKIDGVIVIIMQRLHEKDLSGHVLTTDPHSRWVHLKLPMVAPERTIVVFPISDRQFIREPGDLLIPERERGEEIAEYRERLGEYGFAGQYQQEPVPEGGAIFKRAYFRRWPEIEGDTDIELPNFTMCTQSWDTAIKDKESNSYTVCTTWGHSEQGYFLMDVWRKHVEFPEMMAAMGDLAAEWKPDAILIEDKASGQSAIQELQRGNLPVIAIKVDTDKTARARAASPTAESGKVWIPRDKVWAATFIDECCTFPKGEFNDQVDSMTQFINWSRAADTPLMAMYQADNERSRQEKIRAGQPVRFIEPEMFGSGVYICAYPGCGKEIPPEVPYNLKGGKKYCTTHTVW